MLKKFLSVLIVLILTAPVSTFAAGVATTYIYYGSGSNGGVSMPFTTKCQTKPSVSITGLPKGNFSPSVADPRVRTGLPDGSMQMWLGISFGGVFMEEGTFPISVTLNDACNPSLTQTSNFNIKVSSSFDVTGADLVSGYTGLPYDAIINFSYTGNYTPTVNFTGLPEGLALSKVIKNSPNTAGVIPVDSYSVILSGSPTQSGTFSPQLYITDPTTDDTDKYSDNLSLTIIQSPDAPVQSSSTQATTIQAQTQPPVQPTINSPDNQPKPKTAVTPPANTARVSNQAANNTVASATNNTQVTSSLGQAKQPQAQINSYTAVQPVGPKPNKPSLFQRVLNWFKNLF